MTALPKPAYVMSEPHLSGWRVVLGYETLADAQAAQSAVSAPEAREGEAWRVERTEHAVKFWVGVQGFTVATRGDDPDGGEHLRLMDKMLRKALSRISAAPSADKLRIAVEALEPFANLGVSSGPDDEPCHYAYRITRGAIRNARQALAALKAEGA